jgi:hypothetical protein
VVLIVIGGHRESGGERFGWRGMTEDEELLAHYVRRGAEPWNSSREAAWLDFEMRAWVQPLLPVRRPIDVCNIGIGVGLWDDWLGHVLGSSITSVDRDPEVCRIFELRQRRERHPYPATVICGDVLDGMLGGQRFGLVVSVGSTLREAGDRSQFLERSRALVRSGGALLIAEVGTGACRDAKNVRRFGDLWLACSSVNA